MDSPINNLLAKSPALFATKFPVQEIVSNSPGETILTGRQIASHLTRGSVVALTGTLGSGKTYLVKGIALGLGIKDNITSPTYTIINEYQINEKEETVFYHIDVYRLNDDRDFEDINGPEIIQSEGICVIEWSERIPNSLPEEKITVNMQITGASSRLIKITGLAGRCAQGFSSGRAEIKNYELTCN